jgi:hypothetical protein
MSTTERVKALLNEHHFTKAFVLDDAYDETPDFSQLLNLVDGKVLDALEKVETVLAKELNGTLTEVGIEEDDWETGLGNEVFLQKLWNLKVAKRLPDAVETGVFGVYNHEIEQKKASIKPLLNFLEDDLGLSVNQAGRESTTLPTDSKIVFLDLFLGITDNSAARDEAADKIKLLLNGMADRDRPVVVLMSSKTGEELESMAEDLRSRAGLMGAKFRVLSKTEFGRENAIGTVMQELLMPLSNANTLGDLIDTWDNALKALRETIKGDLRALDLSDYAYLSKFRLEVENMRLGTYLLEVYGDVLRYRLEGSSELRKASAKIDAITFSEIPPTHFLPQPGVNLLSHAVNFVNGDLIEQEGFRIPDAGGKLQLGDLIVKGSDLDDITTRPQLKAMVPVQVVISQVCDLQQGKTDDIFLLEGQLSRRNWTQSIKAVDTRIDCFLWKGEEFSINWQEARLKTWSKRLANTRLAPGSGTHWRVARLRPLAALKTQQLFAAHLTRVGSLASPHGVVPVGLSVDFRAENKERVTLFSAEESEKMGCLVNGAVLEGTVKYNQYLVFARQFPRRLAARLIEVVDQMHPSLRADVRDFAESELALAPLRQPCQIGRSVEHKTLRIEMRMAGTTPTAHVAIVANIPAHVATKLVA